MHRRALASLNRPIVLVGVVALCAYLVRCAHLLNRDHYYILSADSYFFHWQAEQVLQGNSISWHSGLTYPLAYAAKAIALISGMSPLQALKVAGILLPPVLGVASVVTVYLAVSRLYDRRVGFFSAFVFAFFGQTVFIQAAGYLDRDGLSMLLVMIGAFVFCISGDWHLKIRGIEVGWMAGALAVLVIEALLFLEWLWLGAVLLLAILAITLGLEVLVGYITRIVPSLAQEEPVALLLSLLRRSPGSFVASLREVSWRQFASVLGLSVLGAATAGISFTYMYQQGADRIHAAWSGSLANASKVAELQGIGLGDLAAFWPLLIPLAIGLYLASKNRSRADVFCLGWFGGLFLAGLSARRLFLYALPAICVIAGSGLAVLFDFGKIRLSRAEMKLIMLEIRQEDVRRFLQYTRAAVAVFLVLLLVSLSLVSGYYLGSGRDVSVSQEWESALAYLRDHTQEDAVIMSWWDYGYWILDLADRRPVVDNGYYSWDQERLEDIGLAYCANDASEAARIMQKYGAQYLVFSRIEYQILPTITEYGLGKSYGDGQAIPREMRSSLYTRSLSGDFQREGGLERKFPGPEVKNPAVVILGFS